jgi:hypothetical protein
VSQNLESRLPAIRRGADCQLPCLVHKSPSLAGAENWLSAMVSTIALAVSKTIRITNTGVGPG